MECTCGEILSFVSGVETVTCPTCSAKWKSSESSSVEADGFKIVEEGHLSKEATSEKLKKCPYCMAEAPVKSQLCPACGREFRSVSRKGVGMGPSNAEKETFLEVARAQRFVCLVILIGLLGWGGLIAGAATVPHLAVVAYGVLIVVSALQVLAMYRLGRAVYSLAAGCVMSILAFFPCLGYVALLIANSKATQILKDGGYQVGLMGANLREIQES